MRRLRTRGEGYLFVDNRASPGVDPAFVRRAGLACVAVPGGELLEAATLSCGHCQAIVVKNPERTRERAWCFRGDHYICDLCAAAVWATGTCQPVMKSLEEGRNVRPGITGDQGDGQAVL